MIAINQDENTMSFIDLRNRRQEMYFDICARDLTTCCRIEVFVIGLVTIEIFITEAKNGRSPSEMFMLFSGLTVSKAVLHRVHKKTPPKYVEILSKYSQLCTVTV